MHARTEFGISFLCVCLRAERNTWRKYEHAKDALVEVHLLWRDALGRGVSSSRRTLDWSLNKIVDVTFRPLSYTIYGFCTSLSLPSLEQMNPFGVELRCTVYVRSSTQCRKVYANLKNKRRVSDLVNPVICNYCCEQWQILDIKAAAREQLELPKFMDSRACSRDFCNSRTSFYIWEPRNFQTRNCTNRSPDNFVEQSLRQISSHSTVKWNLVLR